MPPFGCPVDRTCPVGSNIIEPNTSGYQLGMRRSQMMWQWQATNYEQVTPEQVAEFFFSSRVYASECFQQPTAFRVVRCETNVGWNVLAGFAEPNAT
jgi:hypothetical protein